MPQKEADENHWAVIFDLDGVVTLSVGLHFSSWKRLFEEEGVPFTMTDYQEKVNGVPRREGIRNMLGELPEPKLNELMQRKQRYFLEALEREGVEPLPGVVELIKQLRSAGARTAVASSSKNARRIVGRLGIEGLFDAIIEGNSFKYPKPDPDIFLTAAKSLKLPPNRCVVIEDAAFGVAAAKNGVLSIADYIAPGTGGGDVTLTEDFN